MKTLYISYFGALKHLSHSQVLPYLEQIAAAGIDVTLLSFEERFADPEQERAERERLRSALAATGIDWRWLRYHKRPSLLATMYDVALGTAYAACQILRKRIDVVHARGHVPATMGLALKRVLGVKLLFDVRGLMAEEYVEAGRWRPNGVAFRLVKWIERRAFRRADALVMLTRRARETLRERSPELGVNPATIEVIPCCVDTTKYRVADGAGVRAQLGLGGKVVMAYAGSLGGWYMSDELVRLFKIGRTIIDDMHFLVMSQSPHGIIGAMFEKEGIPANAYTILTVASDRMPDHLAAAHFGVHFIRPGFSMIANSPTKFGEYLASGLPIVTNAGIGDADALIAGERVGVIVDGFHEAAYREAIQSMARLIVDREEIRMRCRQAAVRHFSLREVGRPAYLRVYDRLKSPFLRAAPADRSPRGGSAPGTSPPPRR